MKRLLMVFASLAFVNGMALGSSRAAPSPDKVFQNEQNQDRNTSIREKLQGLASSAGKQAKNNRYALAAGLPTAAAAAYAGLYFAKAAYKKFKGNKDVNLKRAAIRSGAIVTVAALVSTTASGLTYLIANRKEIASRVNTSALSS